MDVNFSAGTLIGFGIAAFMGFFAYIIFWIIWRRKTSAGYFPLISGIIAYILISLARIVVRSIFLRGFLKNYFTLGLISGVCEELGRFLVFRYVMYEQNDMKNAVSYGIGHGGVESLAVFGSNGVSFSGLILGLGYTLLGQDKFLSYGDWTAEEAQKYLTVLADISFGESMITVIDLIIGLVFTLSLSLLVFMGVHSDECKKHVLTAVGIHTLADFLNAQIFGGETSPERMIFDLCFTGAAAYYVYMVYKKYSEDNVYMDFG